MIKSRVITHPIHGECLYVDNGVIEIGVPLTFGIRVTHFSFVGENNLFYEQPLNLKKFSTDDGWRLRGGHRFWLAPESKADYCPDNEPIEYELLENGVRITQKKDEWLQVIKSLELRLIGNVLEIEHRILNTGEKRRCSLWGVSSMAGGGTLTLQLPQREGGYDPNLHIAAWDYTNLGDERLCFTKEQIKIVQRAGVRNLKIGVGHPVGAAVYEIGDVIVKKHIPLEVGKEYPDGGVSFETYVSDVMIEVEGLSPLMDVLPNESAAYTERLELLRKE